MFVKGLRARDGGRDGGRGYVQAHRGISVHRGHLQVRGDGGDARGRGEVRATERHDWGKRAGQIGPFAIVNKCDRIAVWTKVYTLAPPHVLFLSRLVL